MNPKSSTQNVVITGMGCVTPLGPDTSTFWNALMEGTSGAAPVRSFDTSPYATQMGCEVKDFDDMDRTRRVAAAVPGWDGFGPATRLALVAATSALEEAALEPAEVGERLGISLGTTMGEPCFLDRLSPAEPGPALRDGGENGGTESAGALEEDMFPWSEILERSTWSSTRHVARSLGIRGIEASLPAACSAGNYAVGLAFDLIRQGELDAAIAGGTEAFSESAFAGFSRLRAMAGSRCQPFDRHREGLLLGEGAGMLVLEAEEHARARGAKVLARVLGYGLSCDAHHITGPHPEGEGAARCMRRALDDAELSVADVDYVCCHGTGTRQNDKIESLALHAVFGESAESVPVSSIKALTGHMLGAASAVEAIACVLTLRHGILPPTWNFETPDPECLLDVIPNAPRPTRPRVILNNSYAFGGNNASVLMAAE